MIKRRLGTQVICEHGYGLTLQCPVCGRGRLLAASEKELRGAVGDERFEELAGIGREAGEKALKGEADA